MRGGGLEGVELRRQSNGSQRTERRAPERDRASRLAALAERAPGVLVSMDARGRVSALSAALCGQAPEHWLGRELPEALGGDAGRALEQALRALQRGRSTLELTLALPAGRGTHLQRFRLARVPGAPESEAVSGFIADVGEDAAAELALREREVLLYRSQKAAALAYLAGGVAHDFNNLLTVIVGAADLLREDPRIENELRAEIGQIHRAGERASEITQQLLAYSRREPSVPRVLDLGRQVQDLSALLARQLGSNIRLELSVAPDLWEVNLDPLQVEHVLLHLAAYARQMMPHGGVLWLSLANEQIESFERHAGLMVGPGQYVRLGLRDTGPGLSEAAQGRAFVPFFAAAPGAGSTDLGLPLVRHLVVHAFGHVWLESEPGRGGAITGLLPRAGARPSAPPWAVASPVPAAKPPEPAAAARRSKSPARSARRKR